MKNNDDPPTPDPKIGEAALKSAQLGEQWLNFSKDQFAVSQERQTEIDGLTKQLTQQQLDIGNQAIADAAKTRDRYETVFKPIEDSYISEASNYGSPERQEAAAAEAAADVQAGAATARGTAEREATALGLDPRSGRFAAIQKSGEVGTALATAGAKNTARQAVRDKGLALKEGVVNLGLGLPAQAASQTAVGLGAGNSAQALNLNAAGNQRANVGVMSDGFSGGMQGYGQQANVLGNLYNAQSDAYQAKQAESSSLWSGLGTLAGTVLGGSTMPWIFSDEELKEDKEGIQEGAALEALEEMPVETWKYKDGVADGGEHVGPYAQDFAKATGKGDGHTIQLQDAIGLTMKAVQDLAADVREVKRAVGLGGGKAPANDRMPAKPRASANDNSGARRAVGLGGM